MFVRESKQKNLFLSCTTPTKTVSHMQSSNILCKITHKDLYTL